MNGRSLQRRAARALVSAAVAVSTAGLASPTLAVAPTLIDIQAGVGFTCGLVTGGTVSCWGANDRGQLGNGTTVLSTVPVAVSGISDAVDLGVGSSSACAVLAGGGVRCWGANDLGQLGDGTQATRPVPVAATGITTAATVAIGDSFTCAVLADHTVSCWGGNNFGQLVDGTLTNRPTPGLIPGVADATGVAVGGAHACAVHTDGTVTCWGANYYGQVTGDTPSETAPPTGVDGVADVQQLSLSGSASCALLTTGEVTCWGGADGTTRAPSLVPGLPDAAVDLAAVDRQAGCATLADGTVACWGTSFDAGYEPDLPAYRVDGLSGAARIDVGQRHACVIGPSMDACWGANWSGALGDRGTTSRATPAPISWEPDPDPPTVSAPHIAIVGVGRNGTNAISALLTWRSGDGATGTGVQGYEVGLSRDGGTTWSATTPTTERMHLDERLSATGTVRYRVRASDGAGNLSDWTVGLALQPRIVQDGSSSITYRGTWTRRESSTYLGGATRMTTQAGAKATVTFTGRSVAYVTRMSETRGKVRIYLDGISQGSVDLGKSWYGTQPVVAWERSWPTVGTHTVTIVALGTSGRRPRVDLDAFAVIR